MSRFRFRSIPLKAVNLFQVRKIYGNMVLLDEGLKMTISRSKSRHNSPSIREHAEDLAANGHIAELVKELATGWGGSMTGAPEKMRLIRTAIAVHRRLGPVELTDAVFGTILGHDLEYLCRAQVLALRDAEYLDDYSRRDPASLPNKFKQEHLERILSIEDRLVHLIQTYARTRRVLAMGEAALPVGDKQKDNDRRFEGRKVIPFQEAAAAIRQEGL